MTAEDSDLSNLVLCGYERLADHGFALPCYGRPDRGNARYLAMCSVTGDHSSKITGFELYEPTDLVTLERSEGHPVKAGDPWQDVFLWRGQAFVGEPTRIWNDVKMFREEISATAPLSLLDLALAANSPEQKELVRISFDFLADRFGPEFAIRWRNETLLRSLLVQHMRREKWLQRRSRPSEDEMSSIAVAIGRNGKIVVTFPRRYKDDWRDDEYSNAIKRIHTLFGGSPDKMELVLQDQKASTRVPEENKLGKNPKSRASTIHVKMTDQEERIITATIAQRLIRQVVREPPERISFPRSMKQAYFAADQRLNSLGLQYVRPSLARLENFISKPYARVSAAEIAYLQLVLQHYFLADLTAAEVDQLISIVEAQGSLSQEPFRKLARITLVHGVKQQKVAREIVGDYLLLESVSDLNRIRVSHMRVSHPNYDQEPPSFLITAMSRFSAGQIETSTGAFLFPGKTGQFSGIGRMDKTGDAIVLTFNFDNASSTGFAGGLVWLDRTGNCHNRPVWFARLNAHVGQDWSSVVGVYTLIDAAAKLSSLISDLSSGVHWLSAPDKGPIF